MQIVYENSNETELSAVSLAMPSDYFALLKPRVMSLVVFTGAVGLLLAPGEINPFIGFIAILCIAVGAGASGALNMWYDADIDRLMARTASRPIPAGKVTGDQALSFGLFLSAMSVLVMGVLVNWFAAALLAFTIFFYAVIYTMWLKRSTPQNIVIGGAAGAFPPMIGWAAVTGGISVESLALFAIIFLWTPPHFWALALFKQAEYGKVGVPMMPNVAGETRTKTEIVLYSIVMAVSAILPWYLGFASGAYGILAAAMGLLFIKLAWDVKAGHSEDRRAEKKLFGYSILYLFVIFFALAADALMRQWLA